MSPVCTCLSSCHLSSPFGDTWWGPRAWGEWGDVPRAAWHLLSPLCLPCSLQKLSKDVQSALAKANNTAEETISAMKTVRSFANEETEANVYWQKLQQVYKLNKREAMAYTYYVWSSGVGGWPWGFPAWGWDGQGSLSGSQSAQGACTWFSSAPRELQGEPSPAVCCW